MQTEKSTTMGTQSIEMERVYNAPVSKVWQAITDKNQMKQWYFDIAEFQPIVGFEFQFYGECDGEQWLHLCRVVEVIPEKKLKYSWRYEGYPGESFVTFELFEEGDKTGLKLTHDGLDTFPMNIKELSKENFAEGWADIIGNALTQYLEGNQNN